MISASPHDRKEPKADAARHYQMRRTPSFLVKRLPLTLPLLRSRGMIG